MELPFTLNSNIAQTIYTFLADRLSVRLLLSNNEFCLFFFFVVVLISMAHVHQDFLRQALAGGMAGAGFWATVYPVDVVKSRIQVMPLFKFYFCVYK